jgi:hypothetical protein
MILATVRWTSRGEPRNDTGHQSAPMVDIAIALALKDSAEALDRRPQVKFTERTEEFADKADGALENRRRRK